MNTIAAAVGKLFRALFIKHTVVCPFCFRHVSVAKGDCCPGKSVWWERSHGRAEEDCPSFKNKIELPYEVFDHELFPIVVIGGKAAGKTVYLSALDQCLSNLNWGDFWDVRKLSLENDPFDGIRGQIFQPPHQFPGSTESEADHWPLLVSVTLKQKPVRLRGWSHNIPRARWKKLLLCFTDPAGEHFNWTPKSKKELLRRYPVLRGHVKAVVALMDPSEVEKWKDKLLSYRMVSNEERAQTRATAVQAIRLLQKMPDRANIPIAVCLMKLDELVGRPLDDSERLDDSVFLFGPAHDTYNGESGRLSVPELMRIDHAIRRKLWEQVLPEIFIELGINVQGIRGPDTLCKLWNERNLIKSNYKYNAFFAVSSIGQGATEIQQGIDGRKILALKSLAKRPPIPFRVWDPLLWILWQYGYVGGTDKHNIIDSEGEDAQLAKDRRTA